MQYEGSECHQPHNLGNPAEFTMLELAETVRSLVGSHIPIEHHPLPQDDPKQRRPDISRAKRNLGWHPQVSLETGLAALIEDFRERMFQDESKPAAVAGAESPV